MGLRSHLYDARFLTVAHPDAGGIALRFALGFPGVAVPAPSLRHFHPGLNVIHLCSPFLVLVSLACHYKNTILTAFVKTFFFFLFHAVWHGICSEAFRTF